MNRNETCPNHLRDLGQVAILVRKRVGNPVDYFDKTFDEYEEGFESKGESWLSQLSHIGGDDYAMKLLTVDCSWSQYVEVDPVAGDDVVKLFALGHQLHPTCEPRSGHLLVR